MEAIAVAKALKDEEEAVNAAKDAQTYRNAPVVLCNARECDGHRGIETHQCQHGSCELRVHHCCSNAYLCHWHDGQQEEVQVEQQPQQEEVQEEQQQQQEEVQEELQQPSLEEATAPPAQACAPPPPSLEATTSAAKAATNRQQQEQAKSQPRRRLVVSASLEPDSLNKAKKIISSIPSKLNFSRV